MLGFGDKSASTDAAKSPVFVHVLQSAEAFALAQKIWQNNLRYLVLDAPNHKECLHFFFSNPTCTVWLQRDQGRTDTFELILRWSEANEPLVEVYAVTTGENPIGDDTRAKQLLGGILASPATIPV